MGGKDLGNRYGVELSPAKVIHEPLEESIKVRMVTVSTSAHKTYVATIPGLSLDIWSISTQQ